MSLLCLASASPRRAVLLRQIGVEFFVRSADVDESRLSGEPIEDYVIRIAKAKADAVAKVLQPSTTVLAADTAIEIDGEVLGKPRDAQDAVRMLGLLSGRSHRVLSAVVVAVRAHRESMLACTRVRFKQLTPCEIESYAASTEPLDKAGAYAIQGRAAVFISEIHGSYSGVMGLPLYETAELLARTEHHV